MRIKALLPLLALLLGACGTAAGPGEATTSAPAPSWVRLEPAADCAAPIEPPTLPGVIPGEAELDPATGLHVTGEPMEVDLGTWRLEVTGRVDRPLRLAYDEVRCLPKVQAAPLLDCPGFFVDAATWAGVPLQAILDEAGVAVGAEAARIVAADGYSLWVELTPENLQAVFLAYEVDGDTLPALHGFPLRLVWPGHAGGDWVKWVVGIEVA